MDNIYYFPPMNLLKESKNENIDIKRLKNTAMVIQQTLFNFGVRVTVVDINVGTRFTRYEIQPEMGFRIRDITIRENDIKLATGAKYIHIEAPIPRKASIGIDISDNENPIITLREMIETNEFLEFPSNLACAVGKDIIGNPIIIDLSEMPHLLISGTTGSGKTAFINSLIMSILYKTAPDDVRMLMIDTKGISLPLYNGIPHLLIPVVTNSEKVLAVLRWVVSEIQDRYLKFSDYGVRNLKEFNASEEVPYIFPQILIVIDDLSDLMALHKRESEEIIVRIAQTARAAGIHLIISTQRPSTDVITGLIKANIPSRIAFSVFSAVDSKVILDQKGAEELLGNGDMLFKSQGSRNPIRIQGAYVSDEEIYSVVNFLREQTEYKGECEENKVEDSVVRDELFEEAGRLIIKQNKASIGMLQRLFDIGFNRAARIMDELCEAGVVGSENGTKPRDILITIEEFEDYLEKKLK